MGVRVNAKAKGTRNEHRSKALLQAEGYEVVRAAGSLGAFDLVGFSVYGVVLVQVKSGRGPSSIELTALRAFPAPQNATKLVHVWKDRQPAPIVREVA